MYTLIPEQTAKYLKKEYRIRALILLFLFVSVGIWVGIVSLFPSYIVSVTQEKKAVVEAGTVEQIAQSTSTAAAVSQINASNSDIKTLLASQDTLMLSSIIEDIASRRVSGVTITDFEIGRSGTEGTNIVIQGNSATRDDLVEFEGNLSNDSRFSRVYLPVSDEAADTNINFSMTLTGIQ